MCHIRIAHLSDIEGLPVILILCCVPGGHDDGSLGHVHIAA